MRRTFWALALAGTMLATPALADPIKVGITISKTGPAASLGIPQANTVALLPAEIGGEKV